MKREEVTAKWAELGAREKDAWIENVVFGRETFGNFREVNGMRLLIPQYTTDWNAALNVFSAIPGEFYLYRVSADKYVASFGSTSGAPCFDCGEEPFEIVAQGIAETGPEAIGLAAIIYKLRGVSASV